LGGDDAEREGVMFKDIPSQVYVGHVHDVVIGDGLLATDQMYVRGRSVLEVTRFVQDFIDSSKEYNNRDGCNNKWSIRSVQQLGPIYEAE
jgi:hypothetical protein